MAQFCPFASRMSLSSMLRLVVRQELKRSPLGRFPRARGFTSLSNAQREHGEDSPNTNHSTMPSPSSSPSDGYINRLTDELGGTPESPSTTPKDAQSSSTNKKLSRETHFSGKRNKKEPKHGSTRAADANTTTKPPKKRSSSPSSSDPADSQSTPNPDRDRPWYPKPHKREHWQIQKEALKAKFAEGWNPTKKLSPDAMEGIRHLHATAPDQFTTPVLAKHFKVSPEAIRRILKSKWRPTEKEMEDRRRRWQKRHDRIWSQLAELGLRPKRKRMNDVSDVNILYEDNGENETTRRREKKEDEEGKEEEK